MGDEVPLEDIIVKTDPPAPTQMDAAEEAAMKFTKLLPYVKKLGNSLGQKGVVRVLHAITEFPLGKTVPRLLNESERQLFHVIQELNGAKSTVIQNIMKQNAELEKLKQAASEATAEKDQNVSSTEV